MNRKEMTPFTLIKDNRSSDPVYTATVKSCVDCQHGFYTVEEQYGPDAERRVLSTVKQIHDLRGALTGRLHIFANREALLKEAAPDLEEKQWLIPRYTYLRERLITHARSQERRRQLLLPWLNVEVLKTNPAVLFALLHYRTAHSPQHWAAFDSSQLTLSWAAGFFDVDFSAKSVVMYGERYGSLVDWEEKAAHRADTLGFPRAMLVLKAQAYLMEVLYSIMVKILNGWINLISNAAFRETGVVESWSPYTNQAFSPPPEFNNAMGDHLWYLQCDATYIRRHLKIMFATEIFKKASDTQKGVMITQRIRYECRHVDAARERFRDSTYPGTTLPVSYDRALGALELLLVNQVIYRASCLRELLPYHDAKLPDAIGVLRRKKSANTKECFANDRLYWCLVQLLAKPDDQRTFNHSMLFAMLQEHMSNNPSERARLDENAARTLTEVKATEDRQVWRWLRSRSIGISLFKNFYLTKTPTGPKTSVWLAQSQGLRAALEKFWESMRGTIRKDFEDSAFSSSEVDSLLEVVSANLSEQYLQDKQREEDAILTAIQKSDSPQPATNFFDGAESYSATTTIAPRPEKIKTKAESTAVFEATTITVTRQSFVYAIVDAGFTARNNGGSLVSFKKLDGEGKIVFYKPHPVPKIDPVMLRAMGKRMAKWFGWRREQFVLCNNTSQA
ncbi:hypothetical protein EDB81DRAFT_848429 [Dactylonectria macrodidyma]|uniref:Uncharacterized protein n=1 Tax=Dactylonectria macrodidyma TaxID=307937 RepID=A0A9P9DBT8_9HYPO|nr:hypothetical protein EDB81DRAFT_848429 [Dactylonectria macrodidyma]